MSTRRPVLDGEWSVRGRGEAAREGVEDEPVFGSEGVQVLVQQAEADAALTQFADDAEVRHAQAAATSLTGRSYA
ncbi:predicted protein [Streptomyces viridosporus ATCC 14672]|uniref:Predicted protein n=1 Tax=Streptomyces viridosporus (strain ATCC 14672 / DSM 40746 / JCM 4963 / KCTC 9882 / NRRL B-12104 / FH 1290) TaxID=566461 RepID=D6A471_STRV1|nr:predicted protein [Streptomyces viridosporus ATCC 14672]